MVNKDYNAYLDLHCHYDELKADYLREILTKNNIYAISASVDIESYKRLEKLRLEKISYLNFAYGIYPDEVIKKSLSTLLEELKEINFENAIALGEIGLDYKVTKDKELRDNQKIIFEKQLEIAEKLDKPIIVHTRYATKATLDFLKDYSKLKVVLHWFSGNLEEINEALDRGYYLTQRYASPRIENINERLCQTFIETDYPVFREGKEIEVTGIIDSYDIFCKEYNLPLESIKIRMLKNFEKVFNKIDE
ncbi:MAG: TatD family hydrolase [archaeon]